MPPETPAMTCSAVILSGGRNSRMGGRNKAFLKVGGRTILDRIVDTLGKHFKEMLLVTRNPDLYRKFPVQLVEDIYASRSSLTGIHAGLKQAQSDFAFVVPCDAPFLKSALIAALLDEIEPDVDVIVPEFNDHYEPLCAIYSKRCIPFIEDQLDRGDLKIINFFDKVNLRTLSIDNLKKADSRLLTFFNVNTPEALQKSEELTDLYE